jgi:hypothetical protein
MQSLLFEALRERRSGVVEGDPSGNLTPWHVLNNQALSMLSKVVPQTVDEIGAMLPGVGGRVEAAEARARAGRDHRFVLGRALAASDGGLSVYHRQ